jgi:hypothetical protein
LLEGLKMNFRTVCRSRPCSICLKTDWCAFDAEGEASICRRVPGGICKTDSTGSDYWLYTTDEYKKKEDVKGFIFPQRPIIDFNERHKVYSSLLSHLKLSSKHFHNLNQVRKLAEDQIFLCQYRTIRGSDDVMVAEKLLKDFGKTICLRTPGLFFYENDRCKLSVNEGLLIPVRDIQGRIVALRVRIDEPRQYLWMSSSKPGSAKSGSHIHFPLSDYSNIEILRLTEGELKADVAYYHTKVPTISLPGVTSWRLAIPFLQKTRPKLIKVAFDSDFQEKRVVASSLIGLCDYLKRTGFNYEVEIWNA